MRPAEVASGAARAPAHLLHRVHAAGRRPRHRAPPSRHAPAFSSTNVFAQLEATRQGAGIGVLPAFLTQRTQLRRLLPDEIDIRLPVTLAVRRETVTHAAVRALWAALRQEVAERADELLPE
ncbi:LysR substrate-binding domain-containing protein [Streptomyces sasae]|uniref:LysR substrate-binding domain-containing protein n=1 Tax=Streptomyces sasae TaxID=1266772 RepID=UPI003742729F